MKPEFDIGDKVVITELSYEHEPPFGLIDSMLKYEGKEATIMTVERGCYFASEFQDWEKEPDEYEYRLDIDNQQYAWSNLTLRKVNIPFTIVEEDL